MKPVLFGVGFLPAIAVDGRLLRHVHLITQTPAPPASS